MFTCILNTQVFQDKPIWNSGCQSDPDEYLHEKISEHNQTMELDKITDRTMAEFVRIFLTNPKVEVVNIETSSVYNKWPDEYGFIHTKKKLMCQKKSEKKTTEYSHLKIDLDSSSGGLAESYTRDGVKINPNEIENIQEIKKQVFSGLIVHIVLQERK